jgi:hypothetical protein
MSKKIKEATIIADPMTHIVEVKRPYTDKEIVAYSRIMAEAIKAIAEKGAELKAFASSIKDEIAGQESILNDCAARVNMGYEMTPVTCFVKYDGKIATFTNKETGEIVEQRELTEEEQLRLTSGWKDAEQIIREDSKENR